MKTAELLHSHSPLTAIIACLVLCSSPSRAVPVPGLFDTGVNSAGSLLTDGAVDPHYSLLLAPPGSQFGTSTFVVLSDRNPLSNPADWLADGPSSKWISAQADQNAFYESNNVTGTYIYQLTFDLTGYDPASANITGQWTTDNPGQDILINGTSTGSHTDGNFHLFTPFSITSGFAAGLNTLDFIVYNIPYPPDSPSLGASNPSGLRVELSGTVMPAPEPSSLALFVCGALACRANLRPRRSGARCHQQS